MSQTWTSWSLLMFVLPIVGTRIIYWVNFVSIRKWLRQASVLNTVKARCMPQVNKPRTTLCVLIYKIWLNVAQRERRKVERNLHKTWKSSGYLLAALNFNGQSHRWLENPKTENWRLNTSLSRDVLFMARKIGPQQMDKMEIWRNINIYQRLTFSLKLELQFRSRT